MQRGEEKPEEGKTSRQYISEYQLSAKQSQVNEAVNLLGQDDKEKQTALIDKLNTMLNTETTEANLNEFGRFDDLKTCVVKEKAKSYFEVLDQRRSVF